MSVVRRADDDGVEFLVVRVEHLAKILVLLRGREFVESIGSPRKVHVRDGEDIVVPAIVESGSGDAAATDQGHIQLLAGVGLADRKSGQGSCGCRSGRSLEEISAIQGCLGGLIKYR